MTLSLLSSSFSNGQPIPRKYTCDGLNISPPLSWNGIPAKTISFALVMDDPDAPSGTWVHWLIYNISFKQNALPENIPVQPQLSDGSLQGINSWPKTGYGGPCPPSGTHHYHFKLYALDAALTLPHGADKNALMSAMRGHILAQAELVGTYHR